MVVTVSPFSEPVVLPPLPPMSPGATCEGHETACAAGHVESGTSGVRPESKMPIHHRRHKARGVSRSSQSIRRQHKVHHSRHKLFPKRRRALAASALTRGYARNRMVSPVLVWLGDNSFINLRPATRGACFGLNDTNYGYDTVMNAKHHDGAASMSRGHNARCRYQVAKCRLRHLAFQQFMGPSRRPARMRRCSPQPAQPTG